MAKVMFEHTEYCPHCERSYKHKTRLAGDAVHRCEFCKRIDANGTAEMNLEFYDYAEQIDWKEILLNKSMQRKHGA